MNTNLTFGHVLDLALARPWALEQGTYARMVEILSRHAQGVVASPELLAEVAETRAARAEAAGRAIPSGYTRRGSVGIIPVTGVIARHASQVNDISGPNGTSIEQMRADLAQGLADPEARSLMLAMDTPGGSTEGLVDFAGELRDARTRKPIVAHATGMMASAGFWLGAQAGKVYATKGTNVGSVGIIARIVDASRAIGASGVDVHYLTTANAKALGAPGQALRPTDMEAIMRDSLQPLHERFIDDLAEGRGVDRAKAASWGDGRLLGASEAVATGMIDGIKSEADVIAELERKYGTGAGTSSAPSHSAGAAWDGAHAAVDDPSRSQNVAEPIKAVAEAVPMSFDAWAASNPTAAKTALEGASAAAVAKEQARTGGILAAGLQAVEGNTTHAANVLRIVATAATSKDQQVADVFGPLLKAVRAETPAAPEAPVVEQTKEADVDEKEDEDEETKVTEPVKVNPAEARARLSARAAAQSSPPKQTEAEPVDDESEGKHPRAILCASFKAQWRRMSPAQRAKTGCIDERSFIGNQLLDATNGSRN